MSEGDNKPPVSGGNEPGAEAPPVETVPHAQFHAANERRKKAEEELEKLRREAEERKTKEALERGEHETVIEKQAAELKTQTAKASEWDVYQTARRETLLAQLPEGDRVIYDSLPLEKLEAHVANVKAAKPPEGEIPPGGTGGNQGDNDYGADANAYSRGEMTAEVFKARWPEKARLFGIA